MTTSISQSNGNKGIGLRAGVGWFLVALASFHAAQVLGLGWLLIPCAYALIELSRAATSRKVFYPMLALGFLFYAPQLGFFWGIFGAAAIALWLILAFWLALFGLTLRLVRLRFGNGWMLVLAPFIWTGLEYFRCELYYLRFGWLTFGMANHQAAGLASQGGCFLLSLVFVACAIQIQAIRKRGDWRSFTALVCITTLGVLGSLLWQLVELNLLLLVWLMICTAIIQLSSRPFLKLVIFVVFSLLVLGLWHPLSKRKMEGKSGLAVAGVQLEFPNDHQVLSALNQARAKFPDTQLFMLSEYTFQEPVPQSVRNWCASNQVYLVVGGKEPLGETNFYNTAYVVGTNGDIVHQQVKSVPIQFFKDGLPAPERKVWDSPWGKLGILTCYDLSYTRVVDDFVRQGVIALLNPTMDVADWGEQQHKLHSRVPPMRAAEYGIPIFRVCSSGISQLISRSGRVLASAPFPGEGDIIAGDLPLNAKPRLPLDRWLAPVCVSITALALIASLIPVRKRNHE